MKPIVTPDLVKKYERDGYLILNTQVLPADKFQRAKEFFAAKFVEATKDGHTPALIDCPHWRDPKVFEFIFAPEMLDLVEPGQAIKRCQPLMEIETDKSTMEVESVVTGTFKAARAQEGDSVFAGQVIGVVET